MRARGWCSPWPAVALYLFLKPLQEFRLGTLQGIEEEAARGLKALAPRPLTTSKLGIVAP